MIAPINPENERIRAQAVLRSFTEYENAVDMFVPANSQEKTTERAASPNRANGRSIVQVFNAIKLKSRAAVSGLTQRQAGCEPC